MLHACMIEPAMMKRSQSDVGRIDRKTAERNRRIQMKALCNQLSSLLPMPPTASKIGSPSLPRRLDETVNYIKSLEERIKRMKEKKMRLLGNNIEPSTAMPHIDVHDFGEGLQVFILSPSSHWFLFHAAVRIIEEGAEILSASFSIVDGKAFHTIHALVGETKSGEEASTVLKRLKKDIHLLCQFS